MKERPGEQERESPVINYFYQIPQNSVKREDFNRNFLLHVCPPQECFFILAKVGKSILMGFDFPKPQ